VLSRVVLRLALDERAGRLRQTLVGRYWALVLPLLESGAFTLVFTLFFRPRVTPAAYLLFVYIGVLAWRSFARGVTAAGASLVRSAPLLRQVSMPAAVVPTSAVVGALLDTAVALPLLVAAVLFLRGVPPLGALALWLPAGLALQIAATLGLGWLVAAANAFYRDVGLGIGPLLYILMFAAPVVYPTSVIPLSLRTPFLANPMAAAIDAYRAALLGGVPPSSEGLGLALLVAGGLLAAGWLALRRLDPRLREVL
jgi:lipopolysaccharide transport system permease protein